MSRVLVVGGGAAGVVAALFMAKLGHEVSVFEKLPHTAPLIRGFSRRGLHFDTGFHYAGGLRSGILGRYMDALGIGKHISRIPLAPSGGELLRFGDGRDDFPIVRGRDAFAASLAAAFPDAAEGIAHFLAKSGEYPRYSPFLNPDAGPFEPRRLFDDPTTLDAFLGEIHAPPRLKMILGFRCLLCGVHPAEAFMRDFSLVNDDYIDEASTIVGGGQALAAAFDLALAGAGVEARTGVEATDILLDDDGAVKGIRVRRVRDGEAEAEDMAGDFCLYCGSARALPALLPKGALRPVLANRLLNLKATNKPFMMFGITGNGYFRHRQMFYCLDESFDSWFPERNAPSRSNGKTPFYVSGGDGRDGLYPVTALALLPESATAKWADGGDARDPEGYAKFKRDMAKTLRRQLLDACPEFNGDLTAVETATDVSMRHWSFNSDGSLYGALHGTASSPVLPVTRVGRLALAGQDIILPGLLGVAVSAAVAAGSLMGHDKVLEILR